MKNNLELGCGLIGIGRKWGAVETPLPSESEAFSFLNTALAQGILFFDTAPAYGDSESRLGKWLQSISTATRENILVSTKFGETWVSAESTTVVDHSLASLKISLDRSLELLGNIDILQLHKASEAVLLSRDVEQAFEYAISQGIRQFGASVSSVEAGKIAIADGKYSFLQFPYNVDNRALEPLIALSIQAGIVPLINRPVNMGQSLSGKDKQQALETAFTFLIDNLDSGIVLTGTKNPAHLVENIELFNSLKLAMH